MARTVPSCCVVLCIFCVVLCIVFCDVPCIVCVYMCTEQLPPGGYPIAVKYIISYVMYQTPRNRIILEKLTVSQLFGKFPLDLFCDK